MRAAVLHELGTVPVFGDFKEPRPDEVHQVVEVVLGALNPVDLYIAAGEYGEVELPCVVGREGVARLSDGALVYVSGPPAPFGSLAQFAPVDPSTVFAIPGGLDPGLAVALGIAGLAAWLPLTWRAELRAGETVLVLGATGVVGQIAVQAAKLLGAGRVVAAGRHRPTLEGARAVTVGAIAGQSAAIPVTDLVGRTLVGHSNGHASLDVRREAYERLAAHAAAGEIGVEVERLPLSRIADAWQMQARGPHHKITLVP